MDISNIKNDVVYEKSNSVVHPAGGEYIYMSEDCLFEIVYLIDFKRVSTLIFPREALESKNLRSFKEYEWDYYFTKQILFKSLLENSEIYSK